MKLSAEGLLSLGQIRSNLRSISTAANNPTPTAPDSESRASVPYAASNAEGKHSSATTKEETHTLPRHELFDTSLSGSIFVEYLESFSMDRLTHPCSSSISSLISDFSTAYGVDSKVVLDLILQNPAEFLETLNHANWHWTSLFERTTLKDFVMRDLIPKSSDPAHAVVLSRLALKLLCTAFRQYEILTTDEFLEILMELCKIRDFASAFTYMLVELLASPEMLPYLAGGSCTVYSFPEDLVTDTLVYNENTRILSIPTVLQSRPEPRLIRSKPRMGTFEASTKKPTLTVIQISSSHAAANVALACDAIFMCCDKLPTTKSEGEVIQQQVPVKTETSVAKAPLQDSPDSPTGNHTDMPSTPLSGDSGVLSESPASPESPDVHSTRISAEEKLSSRFRVDFSDSAMKVVEIKSDEVLPVINEPCAYLQLRTTLYSLGGWYWLAMCMIDVFQPEEQEKAIIWPEFQTVAFFNRNVHIVNAFQKNPVWMRLLEIASHSDALLYFSPVIRPTYISVFTFWETCMRPTTAPQNTFVMGQTLWLLQIVSRGKLLHEPYCFLGTIIAYLAPHEIGSVLASVWKVIKTYFPNPHGLLYVPEIERDFRARQMAETDCLLKIRAVCFSRLPQMKSLAKRFFMSARVPLEESRWYESVQSQETVSAPAPIDASHLARVD